MRAALIFFDFFGGFEGAIGKEEAGLHFHFDTQLGKFTRQAGREVVRHGHFFHTLALEDEADDAGEGRFLDAVAF